MNKHTPGPLDVGIYTPTRAFRAINAHTCVFRQDRTVVATLGPAHDPQSEADARLIAAAPDLLEAGRALLDELDQFRCSCTTAEALSGHRPDCRMPWVRDAAEKVGAAIAKAEGGAA